MNLLFTTNSNETLKNTIFELVKNRKITHLSIAIAYNSYGDTTKEFWSIVRDLEVPVDFYFLQDQSYTLNPKILEYTKENTNVTWYIMSTGFHTKLIYGKGVGLYVGSANMTNSALDSNFEVGAYEEHSKINKDDLTDYLDQLRRGAVRKAFSNSDKSKVYEEIQECYTEYKSTHLQGEKYMTKYKKFFSKRNKNNSYDPRIPGDFTLQKDLVRFFDIMFNDVYPVIEKRWNDIPNSMQKLEFTWVADQILYNMSEYGKDFNLAIEKLFEYEDQHLKTIKQYQVGYEIIKKREFADSNRDGLIHLAKSSYAIISRPHMKQETKFISYVDSWLKGSEEYSFQNLMEYFLDSDEDDLVVRFYNICKKNSYKVENLNIGSLGDILGMALLKNPTYDKCYPISNNRIQKFVRENWKICIDKNSFRFLSRRGYV